ncbi:response regulator [Hymenobacter sp. DH14]|uniref:histidine kinase n=1 Tax=Hymenobacter cyanobacteriorum TaxID=2926463 RepID=A0A9X2AJB3_9BACT|nr:response regulator [Hymenobacter cyanobacteriorum]MCI1188604.1 response regulator [Hymenobacter cyanobacteriorum]
MIPTDHLPSDAAALRALYLAERARREQAEELAAQLQGRAQVPELNPNPVLRLDAGGTLRYANAAATPIVAELQAVGPSRLRSQLLQAVGQALRQRQPGQHSIAANGALYVLAAVPIAEDDSVLLFLTDVTAQRQAEQAVADQREFYETIMAHLPAVVTVLGPDEHYRYVNPYAEPDPVRRRARIGRTFAEHCAARGLPPEVALRRHRLFERAVSTRALVSWEERWPGPDGTPMLYWLCYYQPIFGANGVLRMVVCYGFDITTRRLAEARTRQSEAQVKAQQTFTEQVLDLAPNLIYVREQYQAGHQSRIIFQNRTMAALRDRLLHLTGSDSLDEALEADDIRAVAAADEQALRTGQPVASEDRMLLPTGEERWYQSVRCPITMADGTVCILGVSNDITDLKAAQHVAEASAVARENFLANMSHEIRTPLNGVLGMTGLLAKTSLSEQQRNYTDIIQYSGRHLLNVVNDVLDMAKITSGKLELEQRVFNLCDATGQAAEPLVLQAAEKGIRVIGTRLRDSCPLPWVVGDSYRINQILLNLLANAIKFTPAGGTITVGSFLVSETADTLTVEFRVTDTGIGIAPDKLDTIFQEFTQAYADTTRQFGGTGLGLSISRALVTQMGGRLTVQSQVGQGSSFAFYLTLPKAPAQPAETPPPQPENTVRGRRVLLVEDNPVNREVALLLLESHGVLVDEAGSGLEALELFEQHRYDAVLMDIQMPGMNGLDATARIRAHADAARAATPILALTANAFLADAEKYLAAGMNDTLPKPFDEAELLRKLAGLIAGTTGALPGLGAPAPAAPPRRRRAPRPPAAARPGAAAPQTEPAAAPVPLFDLTLLRQTAHGNATFMNRVLTSFHTNTPGSVAELRAAHAAADWPAAAALAHKLRPSLRLLGAATLTPGLDALEAAAAPDAELQQAAEALAAGLEALLAELPREVVV